MALSNKEKQKRFRENREKVIRWYEKATNINRTAVSKKIRSINNEKK